MITGRSIFSKCKGIIVFFSYLFKLLPRCFRIFLWDAISIYSQLPFVALRYILLKSLIKYCGDNVRIGTNVKIKNWKGLSIGSNVSIHDFCYLECAGTIVIEDNVSIAHGSSILSTSHQYNDISIPIKYNQLLTNEVYIKGDVWIGCGCRILYGVTINSRSIVAAGAIVNKNVESNSIYGGIPAKKIKII